MSFDGVLMRSRQSVTASAMREKILAVDALRHGKLHVAYLALAVAGELIAAEREGERGQARIVRRIGEAIGAGRQQAHELPRPEQVLDRLVGRLDAEQHGGELAVGGRHEQEAAGLGLEAGGADEGLLARRRAPWSRRRNCRR